eukprot:COSAG01_NODE_625_length_14726_cov_9.023997_13_plen_83_part_00
MPPQPKPTTAANARSRYARSPASEFAVMTSPSSSSRAVSRTFFLPPFGAFPIISAAMRLSSIFATIKDKTRHGPKNEKCFSC